MSYRSVLSGLVVCSAAMFVACTVTPANPADGPSAVADGGSQGADSSAPSSDSGAEDSFGECVKYTPADLSGSKSGTFTSAETVRIPLAKTDVGGGLLEVTYTQNGSVEGSLFLAEGARAEEPRAGTGAMGPGVDSDQPVTVTYRLAGNKTYELGITPFSFNPETAEYRLDYTYRPLNDCYESNDSVETAKRIPVNVGITAYQHAGIGVDDTSTVNASGEDWYYFELTEPKSVRLESTLPGKDGADGGNSGVWSVYQSDASTLAECATDSGSLSTDPVSSTETLETCEAALGAGKYYVHLSLFTGQPSVTGRDNAFNASWNTPYTLRIVAK